MRERERSINTCIEDRKEKGRGRTLHISSTSILYVSHLSMPLLYQTLKMNFILLLIIIYYDYSPLHLT